MGLGSFKALGGVYAVARLIMEAWEEAQGQPLDPRALDRPETKAFAGNMTFTCASAGNHGLSVAAGARIFGARARIHLARTVPEGFARRLQDKGAEVVRSGDTYEDSMAAASDDAEATGALLLADGSWPGYVHRPGLVMEGYTVIAEELRSDFAETGNWPSVVFLQAGVGGMAAALTHAIRNAWPVQPEIVVVEPDKAPCLRDSHAAGHMVKVEGGESNMGRLDCKEPSMIAFEVFKDIDVRYVTVSDEEASAAAAQLGARGLETTPSGAAGYAAFLNEDLADDATALIIVSEGAV